MKIRKISKIDNRKLGKFLALILRHKPEVIDISLDDNGWADVNELISKVNLHYGVDSIDLSMIEDIVLADNKNRYELDGSRIRARQGHSVDIDLSLEPKSPPESLYHGTVQKFIDAIMKDGLIK
ncbi:MAG TPA: RNA 2'-phosphotransferase, partial [Methanosarcinales archaeon]|nr:RNA 2'-phosphotransferase [Methanosarcinales archaeon]